jgi:Fur family ferric uptake transcriptional regulator
MPHCQSIIQDLRARGYRLTPQREMIIEALAHSRKHLSAEDIHKMIQPRTHAMNIATVYRTLDLLVEEGMVSRIDVGGGRELYATDRHGPHLHLACRRCGKVIEADQSLIQPLEKKLHEAHGFTPDLEHISLFGLCEDCQDHPKEE